MKAIQRERKHDAFLCYSYNTDHEKALDVLKTMEEVYRLNLHVAQRDFYPSVQISRNIMNALAICNHAIILLSTGFLKSEWCKAELDMCLMEHLKDPSFKVFFILTEPISCLLTFFSETSEDADYTKLIKKIKCESLNFNDPQLWTKLFKKISTKFQRVLV